MQPAPRRRPVTYGKKTQSRTFAHGLDTLSDKTPPRTPSKLHMPAASPVKARRLDPPAETAVNIFDVPSSGDESLLDSQHSSRSAKRPGSPRVKAAATKRSRSSTSTTPSRSVAHRQGASPAVAKPKRPVVPLRSTPTESPPLADLPMTLDSPVAAPSTPIAPTPEPQQSPRTPDTWSRKAAYTPKQTQLWTELLEDEPPTQGPATQLRHLSLNPPTGRVLQDATSVSTITRPGRKLVDRLKPSEESELLLSDDTTQIEDETDFFDRLNGELDSSFSQPTVSIAPAPRATYAQQRTFLEDDIDIDALLAHPFDEDKEILYPRDEQRGAPAQRNKAPDYDVAADDDDAGRGVRSIHELRAAGDAKRFENEVNNVLEDIDGSMDLALASRRSGLLTLATKLEDRAWKQRFMQGSHELRLFSTCVRNDDVICGTALAAAVEFLLSHELGEGRSDSQVIDEIPMDSLRGALKFSRDLPSVVRDRQTNMSRAAQLAATEFHDILLQSGAFASDHAISLSPQEVSLKAIETLIRRKREIGNMENLLTPNLLQDLVGIGNSTLPQLGAVSAADKLEKVLSILEASTVAASRGAGDSLWTLEMLAQVIPLLEAALGAGLARQQSLKQLALKLCLNLTNNNESNSDAFDSGGFVAKLMTDISEGLEVSPRTIASTDKEDAKQFDVLILSLGALMNLAEMSVLVRRSVEQSQRSLFDGLVQAFVENREKASESQSLDDASRQIAFGYLAILLANLAQNSRLRARIVAKLPHGRIGVLVEAVEEFISHNQEADQQSHEGPEWEAFTRRLQAVVDSLKDVVGD
ncbi:hypothetical protein FH972_023477 [Carpinus fangiana]|uniref:Wings apart-like protein C-terminal domain-containing protein n=1 Tax=Carpinus fangiana TaxID=176857 RepID=A0A5N6KXK6_9ROSI|nr:hypothetical protein FH972_023477 [Carpinus fangiana]